MCIAEDASCCLLDGVRRRTWWVPGHWRDETQIQPAHAPQMTNKMPGGHSMFPHSQRSPKCRIADWFSNAERAGSVACAVQLDLHAHPFPAPVVVVVIGWPALGCVFSANWWSVAGRRWLEQRSPDGSDLAHVLHGLAAGRGPFGQLLLQGFPGQAGIALDQDLVGLVIGIDTVDTLDLRFCDGRWKERSRWRWCRRGHQARVMKGMRDPSSP